MIKGKMEGKISMKTITHPKSINASLVLLGMVGIAVVYLTVTGTKIPLLSDPSLAFAVLIVVAMAMCAQGGIGRVAALHQWTHPLSILAYLIGAALLLISAATFLGLKLPYIQSIDQAIIAIAILSGVKVIVTFIHNRLPRS
jgi:hypothetical protein